MKSALIVYNSRGIDRSVIVEDSKAVTWIDVYETFKDDTDKEWGEKNWRTKSFTKLDE